jgi:hypothetical protein
VQILEPEIQMLSKVSALNKCFVSRVSEWLRNAEALQLTHRHAECVRKRDVDMGFNLFHLISDVYYRENLHSDIMQAIISPTGSHGQGDRFLGLFLSFLREHHGIGLEIDNYTNAQVFREAGRIDLLICDESSKRAIIIENKINGAADMNRQLVRYLEKVTMDFGYTCDAIIYLCLNQKKSPETPGWTDEERKKVSALLHIVSAYDESEDDMYHGWLRPCIDASIGEVAHVIHQYRQLILKLGRNLMNKPIMTDFYNLMQDKQNHDSAMALNAMLNDLPAFRCQRVMEAFVHDIGPFKKFFCYQSTVAIFEDLGMKESRIKLQADCSSHDQTTVGFWNNDNDPEGEVPSQILHDLGMTDQFSSALGTGVHKRVFLFPSQEDELYQFIRDFKATLTKRAAATSLTEPS